MLIINDYKADGKSVVQVTLGVVYIEVGGVNTHLKKVPPQHKILYETLA